MFPVRVYNPNGSPLHIIDPLFNKCEKSSSSFNNPVLPWFLVHQFLKMCHIECILWVLFKMVIEIFVPIKENFKRILSWKKSFELLIIIPEIEVSTPPFLYFWVILFGDELNDLLTELRDSKVGNCAV